MNEHPLKEIKVIGVEKPNFKKGRFQEHYVSYAINSFI